MSSSIECVDDRLVWGGEIFLAVSAITLLVIGILGFTEGISMSPLAAKLIFAGGFTLLVGVIGAVYKTCCGK